MAFGKKYFCEYKSSNNLDYYVEIWVEGQLLPAVEIEIGASGPIIEYDTEKIDRFSPIISSSCRFPFVVTDFQLEQFVDLLRTLYQEREVYLHLYRSSQANYASVSPLWSGYLVMDLGSGVDKSYPYEQELLFTDGLSLLKDVDWVDLSVSGSTTNTAGNYVEDNMYYGPGRFTFWLREILRKTGAATTAEGSTQDYRFTTAINWYNGLNSQIGTSSDPLYLTKCSMSLFFTKDDNGVFYPDNTYNVLKQILKHWGARITYWKHQFWIVQIPEYITAESGTLAVPVNINSRVYSESGAYQGSQPHLGSTYWTRYEQAIQNQKISKLAGTKYNYLPAIKNVYADFLSFSSKNYYGGFPFGLNATDTEIFQGTINNPSAADFLWLSIPLDFNWDMGTSQLTNGHTMGWWAYIRFNFYAAQKDPSTGIITTYYLQYKSSDGSYYWVDSANWKPLGNEAPKYTIKSKNISETNYIGFEEKIEFIDSTGSNIDMNGAWSFYFDISDYGGKGSFYCNFSGYGSPRVQRRPQQPIVLPAPNGFGTTTSGRVLWSNSLEDVFGTTTINTGNPNPSGFNAGTLTDDFSLQTSSPFKGLLQLLMNQAGTSFGDSLITLNNDSKDSEEYKFGELLWGDAIEYAQSSLQVFNGTSFVPTSPSGEWARGSLAGNKTFTKLLIDEFFSGQIKVVITPSMRLAVGENNQTETISGVSRPRYVNPIGILREFNFRGFDPVYFFRRGAFFTAFDEWDYEGYQIIRDAVPSTTTINNIGNLGGSQIAQPFSNSRLTNPTTQALAMNSPVAYVRQTIPSTGSDVAVNGNFNVAVGWNVGTGWSIDTTSKKAIFTATGSESDLSQSVLTQGLTYQINFRVVITSGTLLVKAGSSGTTQTITTSDDYSIYLECEGSSLIKFQAGTTFTGNITYITIAEQKSLSSLPIQSIGTSVFKIGDTFNLINPNNSEILPLTVTANQGANDVTISVVTTPLYEDIHFGSTLLLNQVDLSEQYQNKTKGTVAGYGITATGIAKSGINITGWLNSDSMTGAAITNVPTALSVKNYVDGQVGASDTLQEVTDNGNTTTNSIMIGSSSSPSALLEIQTVGTSGSQDFQIFSRGVNPNYEVLKISRSSGNTDFLANQNITLSADYDDNHTSNNSNIIFKIDGDEHMRIIPTGKVGIGTTNPTEKLHVVGDALITGDSHADAFKPAATGEPIKFKNFASTEVARITDGGFLGLATSSPSSLLQIGTTGNLGAVTNKKINATFDGGYSTTNSLQYQVNAHIGTTISNADIFTLTSGEVLKNFYIGLVSDNSYFNACRYSIIQGGQERFRLAQGGQLSLPEYGSGTFTGAETYFLAVTSSGDVVEADSSALPGGPYLPLTGGTLTGSLTGTTATFVDSSGFSMTIDGNEINTTNGNLFIKASGEVHLQPNSSSALIAKTNGNVLIGTTTDSGDKLQVNGNIRASTSVNPTVFADRFSGNGVGVVLGPNNSGTIFLRPYGVNSSTIQSSFTTTLATIGTALTGTTATFSGQVTIPATPVATTDAASKSYVDAHGGGLGPFLPLTGGTLTGALEIGYSDARLKGGDLSGRFVVSNSDTTSYITLNGTNNSSPNSISIITDTDIRFNTGSSYGESMRLTSGGNLGVGTSSPGEKFAVNGNATYMEITHPTASSYSGIKFSEGGTPQGSIQNIGSTFATVARRGNFEIFHNTSGNLTLQHSGGNVGIGTTSPTQQSSNATSLEIAGTITTKSGALRLTSSDNSLVSYFYQQTSGLLMGTSTNHAIRIITNNSEKMRITTGGNVGIGTTSNSAEETNNGVPKLQVTTATAVLGEFPLAARFTTASDAGNNSGVSVLINSGNDRGLMISAGREIGNVAKVTMNVVDNNGDEIDTITMKQTGSSSTDINVGIGTTSPMYKLDVNGSFHATNVTVADGIYHEGDTNNYISFGTDTQIFTTSGSEKMRITSAGNVLIGTTSDTGQKLQVSGSIKTTTAGTGLQFYGTGGSGNIDAFGSNSLILMTNSVERAKITSGGNLLIGTTTDSGNKLEVVGGIRQTANNPILIINNQGSGQTGTLYFRDAFGGATISGRIQTAGGAIALRTATSGADNLVITSGGNVGIGTTSPGYKLDVTGTSNFTGALTGTTGQFTSIGVATSPSAVYKLDVNGKARVQSVLELDDVLTLNAISTPADPASGKSSIWMDSSGDIKVKINVAGNVVTKTIVSYEE